MPKYNTFPSNMSQWNSSQLKKLFDKYVSKSISLKKTAELLAIFPKNVRTKLLFIQFLKTFFISSNSRLYTSAKVFVSFNSVSNITFLTCTVPIFQ